MADPHFEHLRSLYLDACRRADMNLDFQVDSLVRERAARKRGDHTNAAYWAGHRDGLKEERGAAVMVRDYLADIPGVKPPEPPQLALVRDNAAPTTDLRTHEEPQ